MGIYFLIAIAFSAMSAVAEVQARPRLAHVQTVRAERRVTRAAVRMSHGAAAPSPLRTRKTPLLRRLTITSASPRAPAFGC